MIVYGFYGLSFWENRVEWNIFKNLSKSHIFDFFMMSGQVDAFFGRQIRIPRQILPLDMCFYEVFWEKIEFAKKFEFSFEGKKVSAASGFEPAPFGLTANDLPLCYAVSNFF